MAYSALVSLTQTSDLILNPLKYLISVQARQKITSIREHAASLISLLENCPKRANSSEEKIMEVAIEAEDIMEYFMWKQLDDISCRFGPSRKEFEQRLKRVRDEIGSIAGNLPSAIASSENMDYLVSLTQTSDLILNPRKYSLSVVAKENIISIREYAMVFMSLADDFPEKANRFHRKIKVAATEAEDIIKDLMRRKNLESWWSDLLPRVRLKRVRFGNRLKRVRFGKQLKRVRSGKQLKRVLFGKHLKRVRKEFGSIGGDMMDDLLSDSAGATRLVSGGKRDTIIGLDEKLMAIKLRLCRESSKLEVIPILGMGGIGKTTLAGCAYEDRLIVEHFEVRCWVTISQDYKARDILSCLRDSMKSLDKEMLSREDEATMRDRVHKCLKRRRYLIVMDDVWSIEVLDDVRNIFPDDGNGSRIILTTRLSDVAAYSDPNSSVYEMQLMDVDRGLDLLRQRIRIPQDCSPDLGDIEEAIVGSCGGLPLAILVMAGLLSTVPKTRASWGRIARNVKSAGAAEDGQLKRILSLSYTHLPRYLRPCLLYMAGFPEDHEIHFSKLSRLCIAEGFIKAKKASESLEERAGEYLEDLVKRRLVLVNKRKPNGTIKTCTLHDVIRDLCIRKAEENKYRLYVEHDIEISASGSSRSFRVLDMAVRPLTRDSIPEQAFELFNLRYLSMAYISDIPAVVLNLQKLQTLIIRTIEGRVHLPSEIWRMPKLRHLVASFGRLPCPEGAASFALQDLQTLSEACNLECTDLVVKMIPNIKKLGILYSADGEPCGHDYQLDNLVRLRQLEKLKVRVYPDIPGKLDPVLPPSLRKITLSGWAFAWEDMAILGSLPNLEVLKLRFCCQGKRWETTEGEFLQLKYLLIEGSDLEDWATESDHFPRLQRLLLHYCWYLNEIPNGIGDIPTLVLVEVKAGNASLVDSAERLEQEQRSFGNDDLQVRYDSCFYERKEMSAIFQQSQLQLFEHSSQNMTSSINQAETARFDIDVYIVFLIVMSYVLFAAATHLILKKLSQSDINLPLFL